MGTDPRPARTRASLISAAQDFLAEGDARPSIPELTKRAGVAHGSFYNHFTDREDLMLQAAVEARRESGWDEFLATVGSFDDPAIGYLAGVYQTLLLWNHDHRTAKIIATAGPGVLQALRGEIEDRFGAWADVPSQSAASSSDIEMAVLVIQGSFHTVLEAIAAGDVNESDAAKRVVVQYGVLLGLTSEQLKPIFTS